MSKEAKGRFETYGVSGPAEGEETLGFLARDAVLAIDALPVLCEGDARAVRPGFLGEARLWVRLQAAEDPLGASERAQVVDRFRVDEFVQRRGEHGRIKGGHLVRRGVDDRDHLVGFLGAAGEDAKQFPSLAVRCGHFGVFDAGVRGVAEAARVVRVERERLAGLVESLFEVTRGRP